MKTKLILLLIIVMFNSNFADAQTNINDYKYVIVPTTFEFLREPDQYRLNTLTKLLLEKYGFATIMDNEILPDDAVSNNCLALKANVLKESGVFNSKLKIELKDCKNNLVFASNIGKSKEKNYEVAYNLALREAFKSFNTFKYEYKESARILAYAENDNQESSDEIEKLKKEIKILKEEKQVSIEKPKEVITEEIIKEEAIKKEVINEEEANLNTVKIEEVVEDQVVVKKEQVIHSAKEEKNNLNVLYAQKITNGFQLVDSTPKVVYKIKATGMQNTYLVEGKEAIIYQLDSNWVLEYYENEVLKTKVLKIKF